MKLIRLFFKYSASMVNFNHIEMCFYLFKIKRNMYIYFHFSIKYIHMRKYQSKCSKNILVIKLSGFESNPPPIIR